MPELAAQTRELRQALAAGNKNKAINLIAKLIDQIATRLDAGETQQP